MVVLDTHALLWRTLDPERLSPNARRICDEAEEKGGVVS
jgi:PIN domain nuclease of toxin-antitoxin system